MASEQQLSSVLSEFARTMLTDFPIQGILDALVERIVEVMPITAAGVTLISPGEDPRFIAASDESAMRFEQLQTELAEGPCLVTYHSGEAVSVPDLRNDARFPSFAARALEDGLRAVFTFPLRHSNSQLGALDLYRDRVGALDGVTMDTAQTLADVASAYLLNARARADLRTAFDHSRQMALHDGLTGLPNRNLLLDRLDQALSRRRRRPSSLAVLFIDIDRFKWLNDSLGHEAGDRLLTEVAHRLAGAARPGDTVARFGGDEFVMLCDDLESELDATALAKRIATVVAAPFGVEGRPITTTLSIGIAFASPTGHETSASLLRDADAAMYRAKEAGRDRVEIFDVDMRARAMEHLETEIALRQAVDRDELVVFYQPEIDLVTNQIAGVEALVRWDHPRRGQLEPDDFIALAEETGLIVPIGAFVLEEACRQVAAWNRESDRPLSLSVNLSGRQVLAPGITEIVRSALSRSGLEPRSLCLEITETVLLEGAQASVEAVDRLKATGVRLAVDDFGTGYGSLTYLKQFPVDVLKIDRSFIDGLIDDRQDRVIIAALADLAHAFGLRAVAEGIETVDQATLAAALGCDAAQGHLWSQPLPADELAAWIERTSVEGPQGELSPLAPPIAVLVVESDPDQRSLLRWLFDDSSDYAIVGEADDGREGIALAARCQPDVVLLALTMPGIGGFEAQPLIHTVAPDAKIVVTSRLDDDPVVPAARAAGAAGYFSMGTDPTELLHYLGSVIGPDLLSGHPFAETRRSSAGPRVLVAPPLV